MPHRNCFRLLLALLLVLTQPLEAREPTRLSEIVLLDWRQLPLDEINGLRPTELSGLAWHAERARLYAVSDRGRLFTFALQTDEQRILTLVPLAGTSIGGGLSINAESLVMHSRSGGHPDGGELMLSDERSVDVLVIDTRGRSIAKMPLPAPLTDKSQWHSLNSGVEALAWHTDHGLMAAPQRPLRGMPRDVHRVYAASGRVWAFTAYPRGASSIKAMELIHAERLLVLEKVKLPEGHLTVLRELALQDCAATRPCDAPGAVLSDTRLQADDNFEGLACLDAERCLLVTDSSGASSGRTLLVMVRLVRLAQR